jgi:hypothetical protein
MIYERGAETGKLTAWLPRCGQAVAGILPTQAFHGDKTSEVEEEKRAGKKSRLTI